MPSRTDLPRTGAHRVQPQTRHGRLVMLGSGLMPVIAVAVFGLSRPAVVQPLDRTVYDVILSAASAPPPSGRVVIVDIDERSLSMVGQWPWPRDLVGTLLAQVRERGAAAIGLDIMFAEADRFAEYRPEEARDQTATTETDRALAETLRDGDIVLGYALAFDEDAPPADRCVLHPVGLAVVEPRSAGGGPSLFRATGAVCNLPVLARAAGRSGFLNAAPDADGILRRVPMLIELGDHTYPGLALATFIRATGVKQMTLRAVNPQTAMLRLDDRVTVPLDGRGNMLVRYRGRRSTLPIISAVDVLSGSLPAGSLRDKLVFVGTTALGTRDVVSTPLDTLFPGVEVQATVADNLLQQQFVWFHEFSELLQFATVLGAGMLVALMGARLGVRWAALATVGAVALLWVAAVWLMSDVGLFVTPFYPTVGVVLGLGGLALGRFSIERGRVHAANQALREAKTDGLTGVANRRAFEEFFAEQFAAAAHGHPLSLLFADVDRFKRFNDQHGHAVGDRVLIAFAHALSAAVGDRGQVFRVGGEEFAVVCPGASEADSTQLAEQLLQVVRDDARVENDDGEELRISCSIGIATETGDMFDRKDQLLKAADRGLYSAKAAGRDCARRAETPIAKTRLA